ncbi:MAG TPA: VOC family protein [Phototrophicaceae bacterium]|jgi:glyoxalase family protein|nr:VOC family protein [Phototrophicaceae bacterium]
MTILGLHHITIVSSDAQHTLNFYTGLLGLRFVKRTVNFDDPGSYHLYFGDETGKPGTAVTFFEWRGAPQGKPGIGGTHHFALRAKDRNALLKWKRRLTEAGVAVRGIYDRTYFQSIYFNDPDGMTVEIATEGPGWTVDEAPELIGTTHISPRKEATIGNRSEEEITAETWSEPVPEITEDMALREGMHHITAISSKIERTHAFFGDLLGMHLVKQTENYEDPTSKHWYWGAGDGKPGTLITYFERNPAKTRWTRMGAGQTHHFALAVADEDEQLRWREKIVKAGIRVSPVMDRTYFKSIYTQDPDGHIVELATVDPGFAVDEPVATLGNALKLPEWLEPQRSQIEQALRPITVPDWKKV